LYLNLIVGGVAAGWVGPYECNKFEIKANSELKEQTSRGRSTYGQIIESVPIPKPFDLNITLTEMGKEGLAIALLGVIGALNQTSGNISNEVAVLKAGSWTPLTRANFNGSLTVTNVAGTTTYNEGVDYLVNRQLGWIKRVPTGTIPEAGTVHVDGAYLAITGDSIAGASAATVRAMAKLDGVNFVDQRPNIVTVWEMVVASEAAVDFLGDEFGELPMSGRMITPAGYTSPFLIEQRNL
jgi:hypothetical protein